MQLAPVFILPPLTTDIGVYVCRRLIDKDATLLVDDVLTTKVLDSLRKEVISPWNEVTRHVMKALIILTK